LSGFVNLVHHVFHAMGDVILKDFFFHPTKRRSHGQDLGHNVDAVSVLVALPNMNGNTVVCSHD
jgi:hypothetical protein